jgi:hypothetical protein
MLNPRDDPMRVTLTADLDVAIDLDEQYPVALLADWISQQSVKSALLEGLIESLNEMLVEAYCGQKHATGNGNQRFQRSATSTRSAVTTAGEQEFTLNYVEDTAAESGEIAHFHPVKDIISFDGKKHYQEDISAKSVDLATTLSYRDTTAHGDGFVPMPSPTTITRRVKEYGNKFTKFLPDQLSGTEADTIIPDGTKCYSQDEDHAYHDVQVTLGEDTDNESSTLLDVSVNGDWEETASSLDEVDAVTDDATVVSDAEHRLRNAFVTENREYQLDLVHVPRTLSYKLWEDGVFSLEKRREIVSEVADEAFHLKNSVEQHRPEGESSAIRERIARTKERLEKTAWQLDQFLSEKAAEYLQSELTSMVTFAEYAIDGFEVPWTSNPVERAMGEVAKRCKCDWMRWSEDGLEALLQLRLAKYANPDQYRSFLDNLLQRPLQSGLSCTVSVTATGGEL